MKDKIVTFGEIMLRLSPKGYNRFNQTTFFDICFGGGEANVAVSLANYGLSVEFVSRLPENDIADTCVGQLKSLGVGTSNLIRGGDRMGIYFVEKGAVVRPSKVIYDRAFSAFAKVKPEMINWMEILKDARWFHWSGITPAVSKSAAETCLRGIKTAKKLGVIVSCDLNYRNKLWKWGAKATDIMPELVAGCDIVMGNEEDAEKCLGFKPENTDVTKGKLNVNAYKIVSKKIMQKFPKVKKVVTTLRKSVNANHNVWSGLIWDGKELIVSESYQITHIVDRVGSGDAFMGGLIYGLLKMRNNKKALDFAVAASALKHTIEGDFNRVNVEEVMTLVSGNSSGRVLR